MYLSNLTNRWAMPALLSTLAFNEARLRMIAENVANIHTPGYRAKHLDTKAFQTALRDALDAKGDRADRLLVVRAGSEVRTDRNGSLRVTPTEKPVENVLFHDRTNLSIEREMAELAETGMAHELVGTLARGYFNDLRKAIRGTV